MYFENFDFLFFSQWEKCKGNLRSLIVMRNCLSENEFEDDADHDEFKNNLSSFVEEFINSIDAKKINGK